jgi:hypothetical protein
VLRFLPQLRPCLCLPDSELRARHLPRYVRIPKQQRHYTLLAILCSGSFLELRHGEVLRIYLLGIPMNEG